jgi:hypothetical protein
MAAPAAAQDDVPEASVYAAQCVRVYCLGELDVGSFRVEWQA